MSFHSDEELSRVVSAVANDKLNAFVQVNSNYFQELAEREALTR